MQIELRKYQKQDFKDLETIIRETWHYDDFSSPKTAIKLARVFLSSCLTNYTFSRVAVMDGNVVGIILANNISKHKCPFSNRLLQIKSILLLYSSKEGRNVSKIFGNVNGIDKQLLNENNKNYPAELALFAVSSSCRGKGIGKMLFQSALDYMKQEKLKELFQLKVIMRIGKGHSYYVDNLAFFKEPNNRTNEAVQARIAALKKEDFIRLPEFEVRRQIQKEKFKLPILPTTTIGSFPQTKEVRANRRAYRNGDIDEQTYAEFNHQMIKEWIKYQEEIDLDVLVHGEFERNDMVEYFGENLDGYLFTENGWVQSYGTRCVKPPVIWGDISRVCPLTVDYAVYTQALTKKPVKGMLTGPVTMLNWSFPRIDISLAETTLQLALAIKDEVLDLENHGIKIIQIDEAALREKLPLRKRDWQSEYLDWAIPAYRLVHSSVQADTQIHSHMCYSEFDDIIQAIEDMDSDVISFEASRSDLTLIDTLNRVNFKTEIGPGVYDIHSPRIPSVEELERVLTSMLEKLSASKLWINPDCGLKTRAYPETLASLKNMVEATKNIRAKLQ